MDKAPWLKKIEEARRGPKMLIEKPSPLSDALNEETSKSKERKWFGKYAEFERPEMKPWKTHVLKYP